MDSDLIETLFNENSEDVYFSHLLESDLLQSSALNLEQTALKNVVGYSSYFLHFILGSLLTLPYTGLKEKLEIEDMFVKLESTTDLKGSKPNILKVFTTITTDETNYRYILCHKFDFETPHSVSLINNPGADVIITEQDFIDLARGLIDKGRNVEYYYFKCVKAIQISKPPHGQQYELTEEWKNDGVDIVVLDNFETTSGERSPVSVQEKLYSTQGLRERLLTSVEHNELHSNTLVSIEKLPDVNGPIKLASLHQPETIIIQSEIDYLFENLAKIYQTYDNKFHLILSSSRIDHCGFAHGAISLNIKNKYKFNVYVENDVVRYHDKITMVIKAEPENPLEAVRKIPVIVDFKDVDPKRAVKIALNHVTNKLGTLKIFPYLQTLSTKAVYGAVCFTSLDRPAGATEVRLHQSPPQSIGQVLVEQAERLYQDFGHLDEIIPENYNIRLNTISENLLEHFDHIVPRSKLQTTEDLRTISRYFIGEAGSISRKVRIPKAYTAEELGIEFDPLVDDLRESLTTFAFETASSKLDVVLNIFENKNRHRAFSIDDATEYVQPKRTNPSVTHVVTINVVVWLENSDNYIPLYNEFPLKHFIGREIVVKPVRLYHEPGFERMEQPLKSLPKVPIFDFIEYLDDLSVTLGGESEISTFFAECQEHIDNPYDMAAIIKGLLSPIHSIQKSIKTSQGTISGVQVVPFNAGEVSQLQTSKVNALSEASLLTFSFLDRRLSSTSGNGMFYNFANAIESVSGLNVKSCNIIFNKEGTLNDQRNKVVSIVSDQTSNIKNFRSFIQKCLDMQSNRLKRSSTVECSIFPDEHAISSEHQDSDDAKVALLTGEEVAHQNQDFAAKRNFLPKLKTVQKISSITAHGTILKDAMANLINGDYVGLCINVGFIAGGFALSHLSDNLAIIGKRLEKTGSEALSRSLKLGSPFLRRATSGLIIYDLVNSIQRYKNNDTDAVVDIAEDTTFLVLDTVDIGIEIAEAFGIVEGVSAVTGPIGLAVGAVVLIGADIYRAVRAVQKLDHEFHLTGWEKFKVGFLSFFHINLESTVKNIRNSRFDGYKVVIIAASKILEAHPEIFLYVTATTTSKSNADFVEFELDNYVDLSTKRNIYQWYDLAQKVTKDQNVQIDCLPYVENGISNPQKEFYACKNALGISRKNKNDEATTVLINLEHGNDAAYGMLNYSNIFHMGNGFKTVVGGNMHDTFLLTGNLTSGSIKGNSDLNTLDFSQFNLKSKVTYYGSPRENIQSTVGESRTTLYVSQIQILKGRQGESDDVHISAEMKHVDLNHGQAHDFDNIHIHHSSGKLYDLSINVGCYTKVSNKGKNGKFVYLYKTQSYNNVVDVRRAKAAMHIFVFDYEVKQVKEIKNSKPAQLSFSFPMHDDAIKIRGCLKNCIFQFKNKFFIHFIDDNKLSGTLTTNLTASNIIDFYYDEAHQLQMLLIIHSSTENTTVVFGNYVHEAASDSYANLSTIIQNDPDHVTHMLGGPEENIFVISSPSQATNYSDILDAITLPDVYIYKSPYNHEISDVIDLRNLYMKLNGFHDTAITLEARPHNSDLYLYIGAIRKGIHLASKIILKNYATDEIYTGLLVLGNVPMKIFHNQLTNETEIKPLPIVFKANETKIILTASDVEFGNEIVIQRYLGHFTSFVSSENDLVITDIFSRPKNSSFTTVLVLKEFYSTPKMASLILKFNNGIVKLQDKRFSKENLISLESLTSDLWI